MMTGQVDKQEVLRWLSDRWSEQQAISLSYPDGHALHGIEKTKVNILGLTVAKFAVDFGISSSEFALAGDFSGEKTRISDRDLDIFEDRLKRMGNAACFIPADAAVLKDVALLMIKEVRETRKEK